MRLAEYLRQLPRGMAHRHEFARRCGAVYDYLRQCAYPPRGGSAPRRTPSAELAVAIERATEGKVARWELRPDLWEPPAADGRRTKTT